MDMRVMKALALSFVVLGMMAMVGCGDDSKSSSTNLSTAPAPAPKNVPTGPIRSKSGATGSITANPNPIKVCDGSGLGVTELSWDFSGAQLVEVRVASPDGALLTHAGGPGKKTTGKWVGEDSIFYLQDVSGGLPLVADNTIAIARVTLTNAGCP